MSEINREGEPTAAQSMSVFGWVFFVGGIVAYAAVALFFPTSVEVGYGSPGRVTNIGLVAARDSLLMASALSVVVGAVFMVGGYIGRVLERP